MGSKKEKNVEQLGNIIRALADVWPNDRENVMTAGAQFEDTIDSLDEGGSLLQKIIDLSWEGMKHLYEKNDYFISVKTATMQAVNTIREFLINDGNISVEDFEKACNQLEKALSGKGESADKIIELDEAEKHAAAVKSGSSETPAGELQPEEVSLNDLASSVMMLDEKSVSENEIEKLAGILNRLIQENPGSAKPFLEDALIKTKEVLSSKNKRPEGWLAYVSEKTEAAIEAEAEAEWQEEIPAKKSTGASSIETNAEDAPDTESENQDYNAEHSETEPENVFLFSEDTEMGMLGDFVTECTDLIQAAEIALLDLEESPNNAELINTVFRSFHTVKGTSAFMGLDPISEFTHLVETLLSMVRDGDLTFGRACADITFESIDVLKKMLEVVETAKLGDSLPISQNCKRLMRVLNHVCDNGMLPSDALKKEMITDPVPDQALEDDGLEGDTENSQADFDQNNAAERNGQKPEAESTVRVNVSRLDRLIDMVGELVIAHSVVAQDKTIAGNSELMKKVTHTTKILRELQDTSLILRMVPLRATFHKMNRLVRDLARKAGKPVKFLTVGEDTEIDRNMVDIINEPLVHMLRNSLDHGIEKPEERAKSGKIETANIWLRAYQEGGKVVIEIEDDGKGIDKEKVLQKGIEKGLVDPEKKLTDSEIFSLIFLPGFSSADKVTDLSGRGVGMDVVRRSIDQLQGKVEVSSKKGEGTKISLELPFTLAITDGMLVKVGDQRFIIPTINIDMTFRASQKDLYTMLGSSEQVLFRGQSVPVIRLHKLFGINGAVENLLEGTMLIIKNNNKRYALLLDEVIGQQQLVGKSINMNVKMPHISGGAILGDGRVGLILDTAAVIQ